MFDRNSVIGFVLLALMFLGFFYFTRQGQLEAEKEQKRVQDSLAKLQPKPDPLVARQDSLRNDSLNRVYKAGQFRQAGMGIEKETVVENELLRIVFSNKGGQPKRVELKKYKSVDSVPVALVAGNFDRVSYAINTGPNSAAQITDLYFTDPKVENNLDGSKSVTFNLNDSTGRSIVHNFMIRPNDYLIDWNISFSGADRLFSQNNMNILWQVEARQHERDLTNERQETQVGMVRSGDFDYFTVGSGLSKKFEENLSWVGMKQKFFNTTLIARNNFTSGEVNCVVPEGDSTGTVMRASSALRVTLPAGNAAAVPLQVYYGPNDFKILKSYGREMEDMVNLGQGIYAFVKYINRLIIMPVFNTFSNFIGNYGLVIALLTIVIRLLTSPLVYTSYVSGAKMKALRPELDQLKEKYKDDQQAYAMEQMKIFRTAGVSPLGGCIPALLQIPIFFSLYSFFNSNIALRGQDFLWAKDLSSYDSILTLPFNIPFYGSHVSLFTLLATGTSLAISIYSMAQTPDQGNPVLKYMPYIFPIMLLGIFNRLPSALTWYYTVSNVITLILQYVIQNYIIDHDKILARIEQNRKKPKTKSKWQERLEQMQAQQKQVQQARGKK